jgi:hypothetical protein
MLRRDRPAILLEAEQRHQPEGASVTDVLDYLRWLAYRGWCVRGDRIAPIGGFDVERDQLAFLRDAGSVAHDMPVGYVNSFLFQAPATAS